MIEVQTRLCISFEGGNLTSLYISVIVTNLQETSLSTSDTILPKIIGMGVATSVCSDML